MLTMLDDRAAAAQSVEPIQLTPPSRSLPSLPSREAAHLLAALHATHCAATAAAATAAASRDHSAIPPSSPTISAATVTLPSLPPLADAAATG